jgi:hypothetical protein
MPSQNRTYLQTARWTKFSLEYRKANPWCLGCFAATGEHVKSEVVDHIVPHKRDPSLAWDTKNLQPACRWHHDKICQMLGNMFERGEIGADQLRLDSKTAVKLTNRYRVRPISNDGWIE